MARSRLGRTFLVSTLIGAAIVLTLAVLNRTPRAQLRPLVDGIWISEQVQPEQLAALKLQGIRSIIDLRPDGEQHGQPSSTEINAAADANGLTFAFVPVPHGDIPDSQVDALAMSLKIVEKPVVLYCGSGRRAARTWALSEAVRPDGLSADAIRKALTSAGQESPDLDSAIESLIATRYPRR